MRVTTKKRSSDFWGQENESRSGQSWIRHWRLRWLVALNRHAVPMCYTMSVRSGTVRVIGLEFSLLMCCAVNSVLVCCCRFERVEPTSQCFLDDCKPIWMALSDWFWPLCITLSYWVTYCGSDVIDESRGWSWDSVRLRAVWFALTWVGNVLSWSQISVCDAYYKHRCTVCLVSHLLNHCQGSHPSGKPVKVWEF